METATETIEVDLHLHGKPFICLPCGKTIPVIVIKKSGRTKVKLVLPNGGKIQRNLTPSKPAA